MPRQKVLTESSLSIEELEELAKTKNSNPEDWAQLVLEAKTVIHLGEQNLWAKADIAHEAAEEYGKLKELCDELGQNYGYWRILSHVAVVYPKDMRKNFEGLSFRHFQAVAHREDRLFLLQKAHEENLSVEKMLSGNRLPKEEEPDVIEPEPEPEIQGIGLNVYAGVKPDQVVELLNYVSMMDPTVAASIGKGRRDCSEELSQWIADTLGLEHPMGVGVIDIFNLMFLGQAEIVFQEEASQPFSLK